MVPTDASAATTSESRRWGRRPYLKGEARQLTSRVPASDLAAMKAEAARRGKSLNELLCDVISDWLASLTSS